MSKLKPCPNVLCNSDDVEECYSKYIHATAYSVRCNTCRVVTGRFETPEEAVDLWNTRDDGWIKCTPGTMPKNSGWYMIKVKEHKWYALEFNIEKAYYYKENGPFAPARWSLELCDEYGQNIEFDIEEISHYHPLPKEPEK